MKKRQRYKTPGPRVDFREFGLMGMFRIAQLIMLPLALVAWLLIWGVAYLLQIDLADYPEIIFGGLIFAVVAVCVVYSVLSDRVIKGQVWLGRERARKARPPGEDPWDCPPEKMPWEE